MADMSSKAATPFIKCVHCGYSLNGARESGLCPECGNPFGGEIITFRQIVLFSPLNVWIGLGVLLGVMCIGVLASGELSTYAYVEQSAWPIVLFILFTGGMSIGLIAWQALKWKRLAGVSQLRILPTKLQFWFAGKTVLEVPTADVQKCKVRKIAGNMWLLRLDGIHSIAIRPRYLVYGTQDDARSLENALNARIGR
jgi:hypothetical protein